VNQATFDGPASVVLTSIAAPNPVMLTLGKQAKEHGMSFYVMGDVPSPSDFSIEGCEFYSLNRQKGTGFKITEVLPTRHYSRKNVGYLLAMQTRPAWIVETDDDNMPRPRFWVPKQRRLRVKTLGGFGWVNIYSYFTDNPIWPRGLPLDSIQTPLPPFDSLPEIETDCPIQQGLADEDPDVDAIYRMALPLPLNFMPHREVALAKGSWVPFNSQNTTWFPEAYPLLYLPSFCSIRMTDIWRSFIAQRIAWENGWSLIFRSADVVQERNEHNLMKDFIDEVPGYLNNRKMCDRLGALSLKPGVENIGPNLILCYQEMVRLELVPEKELAVVNAWVADVSALM
jgi:STELLO glycosyltransferases